MKIYDNVLELIGNTPLVRLSKIAEGAVAEVVLKPESRNPLASVKDRIALAMVEDAERKASSPRGARSSNPPAATPEWGSPSLRPSRGTAASS